MAEKVKRKLQAIFLNVTPESETPTFEIVGLNVNDLNIEYNPQTNTEIDILSDTAKIEVTGYQPTAPVVQQATKGDAVFDYINGLRKNRAVLDDATTTAVLVDMYDGTENSYPAEKQEVSIQIDSYGGTGGEPLSIGYTLNFKGDAVAGIFNTSTKTFT